MEPLRIATIPNSTFRVPPQFEGLRRLAYNLWWTWHPRAKDLFSRIDGAAWQRYRNPIQVFSGRIAWDDLLADPRFLADYREILADFDTYMANGAGHWYQRTHAEELADRKSVV